MPFHVLTLSSIGSRAGQILAQSQTGSVWGNTSKGVFLHLPPKAIIFLSYESYRGPLTANLAVGAAAFRGISNGELIKIEAKKLLFPHSKITLDWGQVPVWNPPALPEAVIQKLQVRKQYQELSEKLMASRSFPSLDLTLPANGCYSYKNGHFERAYISSEPISSKDLLTILDPLLGRGPGLTPFGDDISLGCLLALSRWGRVIDPVLDTHALSQELIAQAYRQTTLLSANLIEAAASGQADERLILTLDGIFTGNASVKTCADWLLAWGDSSGYAALTGMDLAFSLIY